MKNIDRLRQMTDEELTDLFCDTLEGMAEETEKDMCDICPVRHLCRKGHNGFLAWLNKEAEGI